MSNSWIQEVYSLVEVKVLACYLWKIKHPINGPRLWLVLNLGSILSFLEVIAHLFSEEILVVISGFLHLVVIALVFIWLIVEIQLGYEARQVPHDLLSGILDLRWPLSLLLRWVIERVFWDTTLIHIIRIILTVRSAIYGLDLARDHVTYLQLPLTQLIF